MCGMVELKEMTYHLEHNPNCPSPYRIRLVGLGRATIDKLLPGETQDILGHGQTEMEAVRAVLREKERLKKEREKKRKRS